MKRKVEVWKNAYDNPSAKQWPDECLFFGGWVCFNEELKDALTFPLINGFTHLHICTRNLKTGKFTHMYVWNQEKKKWVCTRRRDVERRLRRTALLQSLKSDISGAQSSDPAEVMELSTCQ